MLDWKTLKRIVAPEYRNFPDARMMRTEELTPDGGTMGTLVIGRQGTGKTTALARHLVGKFKKYPDRAMFVLDWSGSISDSILTLVAQDEKRDELLKRIVYDEMGHPEWCIPLPEFSHLYGSTYEEQAQRVATNLEKLAPSLVTNAPYLGGLGLKEIAPQAFRVATAIVNEHGETWQITEVKRLLKDLPLLRHALAKHGFMVPQADWYFKNSYMSTDISAKDRDMRTYSIIALLGAIETPTTKARVGYYRPAWTPREAIRDGLMVIVNGARLINQRNTQHYLFTQVYSLIMAEINKRIPADPNDKPVSLVMDEVYSLLSIPGMAEEIGMLSPLYRSRKLEPYIVLQALSQLAETLRQQIWSIGNIVSFAVSNHQEAFELAQQIFAYNPESVKLDPITSMQQPIIEPDRGQYLKIANDIQRMKHRECIIRRYLSEKQLDKYVRWVPETASVRNDPVNIFEIKEMLLAKRGVRVRDALETINQRNLKVEVRSTPPKIK